MAEALEEVMQAAAWYEKERKGLGREFLAAIDAALDVLELDPIPSVTNKGQAAKLGVRQITLRRFPYDVVFLNDGKLISVIAFPHHSRRPGYWWNRL